MPVAPDIAYRTPIPPRPVERFELAHPAVPAELDGLTVLHVSDLHVRRAMPGTGRMGMVLEALQRTPADVIVLTGDLMDEPGHEEAALEVVRGMAKAWRPKFGVFGVFGNHDTPRFQRECRREFSGIRWIGGEVVEVAVGGGETLRLMGMDWSEDPLGVALGKRASRQRGIEASSGMPLIALAHHPTSLIGAAAIGVPILLAGHTHAGQIRLHPRLAPHTSSDLPMHLASGMLRLQNTLCCISRGLGDGVVEGLRINCPRQMPLYSLRRGEMAGRGGDVVEQVVGW